MSPVRRFAAGAVLAAVAILATAAPATAHDQLLESDPGDGEHLDAAPSSVTMTFSGELLVLDESTAGAVVLVVDAEGEDWATGEVEVRGRNVTAALRTDMPDGGYQVRWQVVSEDGHPIAGVIPFAVGDAVPLESTQNPEPTSSAPDDSSTASDQNADETGDPIRVLLVGGAGAALAVAAFALLLNLRRRRAAAVPPESGDDTAENS
ncbi:MULTISPECIES: copper resistance CopC family protein [unclassified Microbacterium]|uniref:copper resistance CopC family protein n=1 Tax=unclassified Microbacterium TaxID=2609290 RepID=UPI0021A4052F|nr:MULTISPECIES: copper resistance CopC family protein [unclassified Microbacterium]MCT1365638.1 copper resistance protein CopC [Microbacterium sp. p3-SID131]MCT1376744.1 copper resistance protein CopC [Microbacterium sp. p3-SID337]